MTRATLLASAALAIAAASVPASAGQVKVTLKDGRATIVADQATPREIIAEWARVGQVALVDADKLTGAPVSLQLVDVPEAQAIESVLRASGGYAVVSRAAGSPGASRYDRLFVFPVTARPAVSAASQARPDASGVRRPGDPAGAGDAMPFGPAGMGMRPGGGRVIGPSPNDPALEGQGPIMLRPMPEGAAGFMTGAYEGSATIGPPIPGATMATPNLPAGETTQTGTAAAPRPGMTVKPPATPGTPPRPPGLAPQP